MPTRPGSCVASMVVRARSTEPRARCTLMPTVGEQVAMPAPALPRWLSACNASARSLDTPARPRMATTPHTSRPRCAGLRERRERRIEVVAAVRDAAVLPAGVEEHGHHGAARSQPPRLLDG